MLANSSPVWLLLSPLNDRGHREKRRYLVWQRRRLLFLQRFAIEFGSESRVNVTNHLKDTERERKK
jgi:hypothetical protein